MSNRTSAANRAINKAWKEERKLVLKGKGTRNWTPKQQRDILTSGKAHDAYGKPFQGHHMQSVERRPKYQGDYENIQFLTIQEHFEAHRRNWQTRTNWYYDPTTKKFTDFGRRKYKPCKIIRLDRSRAKETKTDEPDKNPPNIHRRKVNIKELTPRTQRHLRQAKSRHQMDLTSPNQNRPLRKQDFGRTL